MNYIQAGKGFKTGSSVGFKTDIAPTTDDELTNKKYVDGLLATGVAGTVTMVTALNISGSTLQYKTRSLTISNGLVSEIGTESAWQELTITSYFT